MPHDLPTAQYLHRMAFTLPREYIRRACVVARARAHACVIQALTNGLLVLWLTTTDHPERKACAAAVSCRV